MKKLHRVFVALIIIVFSFVKSNNSNAQNLVNNWSFEDTVQCPSILGQEYNSAGWYSIRSSPDYFNACNQGTGPLQSNVNVPQNVVDYQNARSGIAYSGFVTLQLFSSYKEFIGTQLNQSLQIGQKYYISFYVSRAVNITPNYRANISIDKIGAHFYTNQYAILNPAPTDNFAHVYSSSIITDTLNWIGIKGSFVADSNYQYVGFGNFFDITQTNYIQYDTMLIASYYFIDDICISPDSAFCDQLTGLNVTTGNSTIKIYPNPARDWIIVGGNEIQSLKIYDVSGRLNISYPRIVAPFKADVSRLASGWYFVEIETKNGKKFQKIIINH